MTEALRGALRTVLAALAAVLLLVFFAPQVHATSDSYFYPGYSASNNGYIDLMQYMTSISITANGQDYTLQQLRDLKSAGTPLTLKVGSSLNFNFHFSLCGRAYSANDATKLDEANSYKVTYTKGTTYLNGTQVAAGSTAVLDDSSLMKDCTSASNTCLRLDISWLQQLAPGDWKINYTDGSVSFTQDGNYLYVYFPQGIGSDLYADPGYFSIGMTLNTATDSIHIPGTDGYYVPGQDAWDMPIVVTKAQTVMKGSISSYGEIKVVKKWADGSTDRSAKIILCYTDSSGKAQTADRTLTGNNATDSFSIKSSWTVTDIYEDTDQLKKDYPNDTYTYAVTQSGNTFTFTNYKGKEVTFSKRSITGSDELPGAKLSLYSGDSLVDQWTSGTEPHTVRLYAGPFTLHEEYAPAGYAVSYDIDFQVQDDLTLKLKGNTGKIDGDTLIITDQPLNVKLAKTDENGKPLAGAVLTLTDQTTGEQIDRWTSTDTAHEITYQTDSGHVLVAGHTYLLHEESAPDGYTLAEDVSFVFNGDGTIPNCGYHTVTMQDKPAPTPTPSTPATPTPSTTPTPGTPTGTTPQAPGRVQTGDSMLPWLWLALGIACLCVSAGVGLHYYRRSQIPAYWRLGMKNE